MHPQQWRLRVYEDALWWSTPEGENSVPLQDIRKILIDDAGDGRKASVTTCDGKEIKIPCPCLGKLKTLSRVLCDKLGPDKVEYLGPIWGGD
jgi:hypothetical protein